MDIILKHFPDISEKQRIDFSRYTQLFKFWNKKINLVSRKDIDNFHEKHILHGSRGNTRRNFCRLFFWTIPSEQHTLLGANRNSKRCIEDSKKGRRALVGYKNRALYKKPFGSIQENYR